MGDLIRQNKSPVNMAELGGQARLLPYCDFELKKDDILYMRVANGGGFGDPLEREPELVRVDVIKGLVSAEAAHDVYGVVIDGKSHELDLDATQRLRTDLREKELKEE